MTIYVAGGWFTEEQEKHLNDLYNFCNNYFKGCNVYKPKEDTNPSLGWNFVFQDNIHHLDKCDLLIASTVGKDMGTLWECGYAFAKNKEVVYYTPGINKVNLMLSKTGAVCKTLEELKFYLDEGVKNETFEIE